MELAIGADPEFFVRKLGKFVSGHTYEFGTKEHPLEGKDGSFQNDGMALELNTPPMTTEDGFVFQFKAGKLELERRLRDKDFTAFLVAQPTVHFEPGYIETLPKNVQELGCRPDYDAWLEAVNPPPNGSVPFRTGSGHVHLGWTHNQSILSPRHFQTCCEIVRELDYWLGLPSLLWDDDNTRRKLYGKAGAFRPKPYGLEYRTLSNAWCKNDPLVRQVYRLSRRGFEYWEKCSNEPDQYDLLQEQYGDFAKICINNNDKSWPGMYPELFEMICGVHNA